MRFETVVMAFGGNDASLKVENGVPKKMPQDGEVVKDGDNSVKPVESVLPIHHPFILHPSLKIKSKGETPDPELLGLEEELPGWHGYVEWENYPERKKKIKEFMKKFDFPGVSCSVAQY